MGKLKIKLNRAGVRELLRSPEMQAMLEERANAIGTKAGDGYKVYTAKTRAVAVVQTVTAEAARDNLKNNTLLKAMK